MMSRPMKMGRSRERADLPGRWGEALYSDPYPLNHATRGSPLGASGARGLQARLFVQDGPLTPSRRAALKAKLKAGELDELLFRAVVFRDGPNANHTRFRPSDLEAFAESFSGVPFLRNHAVEDVGARDGVVVDSRLVSSEFHQTIRLTTERGMKDFLEGVIDRFSIGWYFEGVECGICGEDWFECPHWPGQKINGRHSYLSGNGERRSSMSGNVDEHHSHLSGHVDGQRCELIFVGPRGKETSAVNAPAVQGTRVLEQLCMLKRHSIDEWHVSKRHSPNQRHSNLSGMKNEWPVKERMMSENAIVLPDGSLKVVAPRHSGLSGMNQEYERHSGLSGMNTDGAAAMAHAFRAEMEALRVEQLILSSGLSDASQSIVRAAAQGKDSVATAQLIETQRLAERTHLNTQVVRGIRPVDGPGGRTGIISEGMMSTPHDRMQSALNWVFGAREEPLPVPSMRSIRELYQAITGDHNWRGVFSPEWSQLSAASTTTLAGMVVNAFNKVVRMHYDNMATYRWYERVVDVAPHDGSTHDVQLILVDGLANLPTVIEGAAYTEVTVGDSKESLSFTKHGHYVGITLETIRRSDIQRIQAIPRAMVQASVRTRSAAIASIFTMASGTGPTLADDSTVLFHNNHGNLGTAAFDTAGWAAARLRIWEQQIPGTSKPLGLWPTFVLVPIELYDDALAEFGYGTGDVGKPSTAGTAQVVNPYGESRLGDPRPVLIPVPEWTDATDWAYMVDPRLHPVIHMAYANAPQGGQHPMPEIYEVTSESSGLMFTNDTLPVKVRDWWGYGVATYTGIGKNNVSD